MDVFEIFAQQPHVLVLFAPLALAVAARPVWGIYWLVLLVSTHRALYAMGLLSTGVKVLLDDGLLLAMLLGSLVAAVRYRRLTVTEAGTPFVALLLVILISAVANHTSLLTVTYGIRFSLLYVVLFFTIRNIEIGERSIYRIVNLAIVLGAINAVVGIGQFLGVLPGWALTATVDQLRIGAFYRATGLLGGAGDLGCYLVATACLALVMSVPGLSAGRARSPYVVAAVVMAAAILCTAGRASIVAMLVGSLAIAALTGRGRRFIVALSVLILCLALLTPVVSERFLLLPSEYEPDGTMRALYFYTGLQVWKAHPALGVGMGTYGGAAGGLLPEGPDWETGVYSQIDNYLLAILIQIGVVGLAAFGWLLVRIARRQFRIAREREGLPGGLALAALAIMAAAVPLSLAGPSLEQHAFALFFWSVPALAALSASGRETVSGEYSESEEHLPPREEGSDGR
jgi:O-antigen ligase